MNGGIGAIGMKFSGETWPWRLTSRDNLARARKDEEQIMRIYYAVLGLLIGVGWYLYGNASLIPDSHVQSAGWSLPNSAIGQVKGYLAMIGAMATGKGQSAEVTPIAPPTAAGKGGTNNGQASNAPTASPKANDVAVPPNLIRLMNPAMVTTARDGTQSLNPEAQAALRQIIAQSHANAPAFKDQPAAASKATRVSQ